MKKLLAFLAIPFVAPLHHAGAAESSNQMVLSAPFPITCTTGGVQVIAKNPRRTYLICANTGAAVVYIAPNTIPTSTTGLPIPASNGSIVWENQAPINSMYCTSSSSNQVIVCAEGN